jgi:hypothetical protein
LLKRKLDMRFAVMSRLALGWMTGFLLWLSANGICLAGEETEAEAEAPKTIAEFTSEMHRHEGLIDSYLDADAGKVYLVLPAASDQSLGQFLYYEGLKSGLGSNPVGLDRSQLGSTRFVEFRMIGGRVVVEEPNWRYRAVAEDAAEREAARESFATSILWATDVVAKGEDGEILIDFTEFLLRDEHGIVSALKNADQGEFSKDENRCFLDTDHCRAFPKNLVFESILTFQSDKPGSEVRATTPDPRAVTLRLHHSLIELPDDGYQPRRFDPRIGSFTIGFSDYGVSLDKPIARKLVTRHRLEKVDPTAKRSRVKQPIVYYIDRGAPEPVRSALLDGARWWSAAFEEAGFVDAYHVELLPEGADPMDVRYKVINWVHRATRGWSYGSSVVDPRTGEIIKGHVLLGSLRIRQDRLLFEGLAGTDQTGTGSDDDPIQLALARIRQLSAHEVGHTLGIAHNYAASTYGRESVMDYPAPLVTVNEDGLLDFTEAYAVGIGTWDKHTVKYMYSQFAPNQNESAELERIVLGGIEAGLFFLSDADAQPASAANPRANLWDNGATAEQSLQQIMEVRRIAMREFSENRIAKGRPLALLEEVYVPIYFMHRYSVDAAAKVLGGYDYHYAMRGDGQDLLSPMPRERQEKALQLLLSTLDPKALDIPEATLKLLLPRPLNYGGNRELFAAGTPPIFDAVGAAATASRMTASRMFQAARCARLIDQHRRDSQSLSLQDVNREVSRQVFEATDGSDRERGIRRATQNAVIDAMIALASDTTASASVRAPMEFSLRHLQGKLKKQVSDDYVQTAHRVALVSKLQRFFDRQLDYEQPHGAADPPPGSPIGGGGRDAGGLQRRRSGAINEGAIPFDLGQCGWGCPG